MIQVSIVPTAVSYLQGYTGVLSKWVISSLHTFCQGMQQAFLGNRHLQKHCAPSWDSLVHTHTRCQSHVYELVLWGSGLNLHHGCRQRPK